MELYRLTAMQALHNIRANELTVEDYAKSLLKRIQERDSAVKAWAYLDPVQVLNEARRLDQIPQSQRGPLHGVPVGVKDVIYTKGMPTQHNSSLYEGSAPQVDAASVLILRNAGALILGKTTTTEFSATTEGPKSRNPHDQSRTPGGSSSGSSAAVADFQVPVSLGTQTGGSTIRPGSFNGVWALKPTWNAISREGQKICSLNFDTLGLFARSVEDLGLLANVFGLEDDEAPPTRFLMKGAKFAVCRTPIWEKAGPGTRAALEKAVALLKVHGAQVDEVDLGSDFRNLPQWHATVQATDGHVSFLPEYRRPKGKENLGPLVVEQVENTGRYTHADQLRALDGMAALRPKIDTIAGRYAAILTPSVVDEAPVGFHTGSYVFNNIWTALHVPVINVPGFRGKHGLPIGLSLIAPRYHDQWLLSVAKEVGRIFESEGGWKSKL
ncbi:amidase [Aspergillus glaucus CBS 516.65]|uniref:Amidase domain-containing protein n=1 Tax=Aspergillus glaucus CBS 516.65 TaxID=1160497 RepID=A0A1L9VGY6_ASPGL|nr:hypothetical protein ASPGLDRAFT_67418 [Aspergillus glaucus CBS 516.65]OJJ83164.1 hypothetical protein ASPGLDRAFT_67418 [Aspergillus glaucus CBS 516.65]